MQTLDDTMSKTIIQIFDMKLRCSVTLIIVLVFLEEEDVESDDNKNLKPNLKNDSGAGLTRNDNNRRSSRKMKNAPPFWFLTNITLFGNRNIPPFA